MIVRKNYLLCRILSLEAARNDRTKTTLNTNNQNHLIMEDIASKVISIIVYKLGAEESEVTPAASFKNDLGADSLDTVELIMEFEKEFNITIPDDVAEKISTVQDAIDYIKENVQ